MATCDLYDVWSKACNNYDLPEASIRSWYERIKTKLSDEDSKRVYHNWSFMMAHKRPELERAKPHIVLAAFFQYYEFDLQKNCVAENCEIFREFCRDAMVEDDDVKQIVCHLLGEKSTEPIPSDIEDDQAKLQDLDLLILASPTDVYKNYAELSRQEWLNAGKTNYEELRRKTLTALLALDIYQTSDFNAKYAKSARSNIEQELKDLE
ncbi:uncharacterized protein LOC106091765 [Stomoxys calcitrans]|uniref:uncharacterized protein LOC106091765 n=1 Tax=Stomoxys calcitrans TaxID=35570 RepID=UPI0027E306A8|nr:uncharacterized protein LOC106091765 [Stomoxys calcitrans]